MWTLLSSPEITLKFWSCPAVVWTSSSPAITAKPWISPAVTETSPLSPARQQNPEYLHHQYLPRLQQYNEYHDSKIFQPSYIFTWKINQIYIFLNIKFNWAMSKPSIDTFFTENKLRTHCRKHTKLSSFSRKTMIMSTRPWGMFMIFHWSLETMFLWPGEIFNIVRQW